LIHLYIEGTGTTACGDSYQHRSWALDIAQVTCLRCIAAHTAWRKEAARAMRVVLLRAAELFPPHVRDTIIDMLLAVMCCSPRKPEQSG